MQTRPFFLVEAQLQGVVVARYAFWRPGPAQEKKKELSTDYGDGNVSMINNAELIEEMIKSGDIKPENVQK